MCLLFIVSSCWSLPLETQFTLATVRLQQLLPFPLVQDGVNCFAAGFGQNNVDVVDEFRRRQRLL
jgi:hypothetical protein